MDKTIKFDCFSPSKIRGDKKCKKRLDNRGKFIIFVEFYGVSVEIYGLILTIINNKK